MAKLDILVGLRRSHEALAFATSSSSSTSSPPEIRVGAAPLGRHRDRRLDSAALTFSGSAGSAVFGFFFGCCCSSSDESVRSWGFAGRSGLLPGARHSRGLVVVAAVEDVAFLASRARPRPAPAPRRPRSCCRGRRAPAPRRGAAGAGAGGRYASSSERGVDGGHSIDDADATRSAAVKRALRNRGGPSLIRAASHAFKIMTRAAVPVI